ncbi:MAG: hypothetical protein JW892_09310 [Anaerolineae bacterium]|nr:hypothetical protein [Anaerolineae bacterium]
MKQSPWSKIPGILGILLLGVLIGAIGLTLLARNIPEIRYSLLQGADLQGPQAQIDAFVQALLRGDAAAATELWEVSETWAERGMDDRRDTVIADLLQADIAAAYQITNVEWWRTCCEPGVTCDSRGAGGARIMVQFMQGELPLTYMFDVFAREQPYFGAAIGYPPRDWVIRDIYPRGDNPLFWNLVYEPDIHQVQSAP